MTAAILVVTGASGSGKTTAVQAVEARSLPGVRCYYFDSIGVPSPEEMKRDFGGGEQWQAVATQRWLERLAGDPDGAEIYILDGQTRPSSVIKAAEQTSAGIVRIALFDCEPPVRNKRLIELRKQAELANPQMDCWAAYLCGQADALNLPIVDTTNLEVHAVADSLVTLIESVRAERRTALGQVRDVAAQ